MIDKKEKLPVERFDSRLALELEERTEFVEWSVSGGYSQPCGSGTCSAGGGAKGNWP